MLVLGLLFRFVSKYAEYGVSKLICGIYNQGRVSTIKAHVLCRLCLRCFHTTANAKVCLFSVRNAVDPRPCLLNAKLIDRTITLFVPINYACLQRYLKLGIYSPLYVEIQFNNKF